MLLINLSMKLIKNLLKKIPKLNMVEIMMMKPKNLKLIIIIK